MCQSVVYTSLHHRPVDNGPPNVLESNEILKKTQKVSASRGKEYKYKCTHGIYQREKNERNFIGTGCNRARTGRLAAFCDACAELLGASANDVGRMRREIWVGKIGCAKNGADSVEDGSTSRITMGSFDIQ